MRLHRLVICLALCLAPAAALAAEPNWPAELTIALISNESSTEVVRRWMPILAQLERDLGVKVKPLPSTDYRGTIEALRFKKAELGWLGPKAYIEAATNNYANVEAIAQVESANGSSGYRSCLIAHTDSDLFSPEHLQGRTFAFNDPNSTSGYLVPMALFLNEMGVNPKSYFSKLTFSGSHESSVMAVAAKKVDAASTSLNHVENNAREGKIPRAALRVIWVSKLIPQDPIAIRKDLPASLSRAIQDSLVRMKAKHPEAFAQGGANLGGFVKADDATYEVIRELNETTKRLASSGK